MPTLSIIAWPAQRTAVKQRPHQETESCQEATSEPVVRHHGREGGGAGSNEVRPTASTACWAALPKEDQEDTDERRAWIADRKCAAECASQDDGCGWREGELVDTKALEVADELGGEADANKTTHDEANDGDDAVRPAIGRSPRILTHKEDLARGDALGRDQQRGAEEVNE